MKIEREEDELTSGDDMENGPLLGYCGRYTTSFNLQVDEETEPWRD